MPDSNATMADAVPCAPDTEDSVSVRDIFAALRRRLWTLLFGTLTAGAVAYGLTGLITPTFTASTTFLPPQQSQTSAASALASLGALGGLAAGAGGLKTPGDQYIALMQSVTVSDRIVDRFKLMEVYGSKFRVDARRQLGLNVRIGLGKKDGLISVDVDDESPQRAADIANRYVEELRALTATLAVSEAQQRRVFFEQQLKLSRERLTLAQQELQGSGFNPGALKAEPKAEAESYARLRAEVTAGEVRLQGLRAALTDTAPEIRQQQSALDVLRAQLARVTQPTVSASGPDYVGKYREFKYQETLFELYARQFELARVDESREGALIQVVDVATAPERKSKPKRLTISGICAAVAMLILMTVVLWPLFFVKRASHPRS